MSWLTSWFAFDEDDDDTDASSEVCSLTPTCLIRQKHCLFRGFVHFMLKIFSVYSETNV